MVVDQDGVVDKEPSVVSVLRVEGQTQEAPLITQPLRSQHITAHVQEGLLQAAAVSQVNPNEAQLLGHKHAVGAVPTVEHQHRVPQPIGHLCQTQLQAALWVLHHFSQVAVQLAVLEHAGIAVVLVGKVYQVAEERGVFLTRFLKGLAVCQILDHGMALSVEVGAVAEAQSREVAHWSVRVFSIIQMCSVRRALL